MKLLLDIVVFHCRNLFLTFLVLLVSACETLPYAPVESRQQFLEIVTNKPLSWPGGYSVRFDSNGGINGHFPNGTVEGNWHWRNNLFCRSISIAGVRRTDECLAIEYNGEQIRFRRSNGSYFLPYNIGPAPE